MSDRYWKVCERRVARFFGAERGRGSGSGIINRPNVEETASDSTHPRLYIECKSASGPSGSNRWLWVWLAKMGWPKGLWRVSGLYLAHSSHIEHQAGETQNARRMVDTGWILYKETFEAARCEQKVPLVALCCKRQRGFWLLAEPPAMLEAIKERADAKAAT